MGAALKAIGGGLGDIFSRLFGLSILCVLGAGAATAAAAWGAINYLVPLIPEAEGVLGFLLDAADWLAGAGIIVLAIALAPGVSMFLGSALFDIAAARVERAIGAPPGRNISIGEGLLNGARIGLPAVLLNLLVIPFLFVPVLNAVVFLWLNGFLMGREFFSQAAVRRMSWKEAKALRRQAPLSAFLVGVVAAVFPLVAPLFAASAMTRLVNALSARTGKT